MALIIANWKMYFTLQEAEDFCTKLVNIQSLNHFIIAPPVLYIAYLVAKYPSLDFAAQNVSRYNDFGAFTGEYSATMLKSCQVNYAIIGHSEIKKLYLESEAILYDKIINSLNANLIPIICLDEKFNKSFASKFNFIDFQISNLVAHLNSPDKKAIIAYEPSTSIGSGVLPSLDELKSIFAQIKLSLNKSKLVNKVKLVYGGSVTSQNITPILSIDNIDGVLIGNCAINQKNLIEIIQRGY